MVELGRPLNIFQVPELQDSNRVLNAFLFEHKRLGEPSISHKTAILDEDEINIDSLSLSLSLFINIRSLALLLSSLFFSSGYCDELSLKKKKKMTYSDGLQLKKKKKKAVVIGW